ncbi:hypothetical protein ACLSY8_06325 [Avibacterium avium]|uniref:hypothetical protein n=1 Tax=Avibacterium avium TaxID=751 RepID=UPI003BF8DB80
MFRKLTFFIMIVLFSGVCSAEWVSAELLPSNNNFLDDYKICNYRVDRMFSSIHDEEFSIRVKRSSCPYRIEIDPETNRWRER